MYLNMLKSLNDYASLVSIFLGFIVGIFAIWKLFSELKIRRLIQQEHILLLKREIEFKEQEQQKEIKKRKEYREWLEQQEAKILSVSVQVAETVARQLRKDVSWASDALEKANIKPAAQTLFAERWGHF